MPLQGFPFMNITHWAHDNVKLHIKTSIANVQVELYQCKVSAVRGATIYRNNAKNKATRDPRLGFGEYLPIGDA